jgi:hypothetical protein
MPKTVFHEDTTGLNACQVYKCTDELQGVKFFYVPGETNRCYWISTTISKHSFPTGLLKNSGQGSVDYEIIQTN